MKISILLQASSQTSPRTTPAEEPPLNILSRSTLEIVYSIYIYKSLHQLVPVRELSVSFSLQSNAFCFSLQSNAFYFSLQSNAFYFSLQANAFYFSLQSNAFSFSLQLDVRDTAAPFFAHPFDPVPPPPETKEGRSLPNSPQSLSRDRPI